MTEQIKVGLVLSGGGAKGAYQVGVLRALQELGMQIDMVSGASIGALNGGILASAPTLVEGIKRIENLWNTLAQISPIQLNSMAYIKLAVAAGSALVPSARFLILALGIDEEAILSDKPLTELMDEYLDINELAKGIPLYISVYKSLGATRDIGRCFLAATELKDTPDSEFLHVQSLPKDEQRNALLASAALPKLFKAQKVLGKKYTDGGQGGWSKAQGNTPIQPLIDAGCNFIIVTHLSNGSFWNRNDFPGVTVLEIRPQAPIARATGLMGGAKDLLGFDASKIPSWIEQGYSDTLHCIGRVKEVSKARGSLQISEHTLRESEKRGKISDSALDDILSRMKKS